MALVKLGLIVSTFASLAFGALHSSDSILSGWDPNPIDRFASDSLSSLRPRQDSSTASLPRWGQATALVRDTLFVHGGKTDKSNQFSYTAAPNTNDLLSLSLSSSFSASSPPWSYIGGSSNSCATQGPAVAWHTLDAFLSSELIAFGGDPGPNAQVLPDSDDSATLVDVSNRLQPTWLCEDAQWAGEPTRRIYHRGTTFGGKVYYTGGAKVDMSGLGFADHWLYDPSGPDFTQLPSDNGPPDIYGHAAVTLPDGRFLVFGGLHASAGMLNPFSTVWAYDTSQNSWSAVDVSTSSLPTSRRNFAAAYCGGKIYIQGGADATMENIFGDGWALDTTVNPMVWTAIDALSAIGTRRDHFAVCYGTSVLWGFGYAAWQPAPAGLQVYDIPSGSMVSTYTPPSTPSYFTTIPYSATIVTGGTGATTLVTTNSAGHTVTSIGVEPTSFSLTTETTTDSKGHTHTATGIATTATTTDSSGHSTTSTGVVPVPTVIPPATGSSSSSSDDARNIALGAVFGALGLIAGAFATAYYVRRNRSQSDAFHHLINDDFDDDGGSPHMADPAWARSAAHGGPDQAGVWGRRPQPGMLEKLGLAGLAGAVGLSAAGRAEHEVGRRERRDMLADEDTREFDYADLGRHPRRGGSGSDTSSYTGRRASRPTFGALINGSLASLRSVGAMLTSGGAAASGSGARATKSREPSGRSVAWRDRDFIADPFTDEAALMGTAAVASLSEEKAQRPRGGRQYSSASSRWSYADPFAEKDGLDEDDIANDYGYSAYEPTGAILGRPGQSVMPGGIAPGGIAVEHTPLSPVTERNSSQFNLSSEGQHTPFGNPPSSSDHGSRTTPASSREFGFLSQMSHDNSSRSQTHSAAHSPYPGSPSARPSSILDANPNTASPNVTRSNSFWTRFYKSSWRDRRSGGASASASASADGYGYTHRPGTRAPLDFRDPNPAPRLIAIEEQSLSPVDDRAYDAHGRGPSSHSQSLSPMQILADALGVHGRSASSLHTSRTADSEALERLAGGGYDVVHRDGSHATRGSHLTSPSTGTGGSGHSQGYSFASSYGGGGDAYEPPAPPAQPWRPARPALSVVESAGEGSNGNDGSTIDSPAEMTESESMHSRTREEPPSPPSPTAQQPMSPGVASRVREFERRMSQDQPLEKSTRAREVRPKKPAQGVYGLAPRPPLFVANRTPNASSERLPPRS